jgi:protein-tyrosine phosphatase
LFTVLIAMVKILFVCLGNICRSPLAKAIFKYESEKRGIQNLFEVHSCGTANYHVGDSPDSRTIRNAKKNGIIIDHRGRQLCNEDMDYYDYIFVMDKSNYDYVVRLRATSATHHKVHMLRHFDAVKGEEVPDPYYGQEKDFQEVFEILVRAVDGVIGFLQPRQ